MPAHGRWFTYAELRRGGRDAEAWLPLQADQPTSHTETRELYLPTRADATTRPVEVGAGTVIYCVGLSLLAFAFQQAIRGPVWKGPAWPNDVG